MDEQKPPGSEEKDADAPGEPRAGGCGGAGAVPPWGAGCLCPPPQRLTAAVPAADQAVALEEMGSAEGDPLKLPKGASAGPELESMDTKGPR